MHRASSVSGSSECAQLKSVNFLQYLGEMSGGAEPGFVVRHSSGTTSHASCGRGPHWYASTRSLVASCGKGCAVVWICLF